MIEFLLKHPKATHEMLGFLPEFLSARDPRPAVEQLDANYSHGGGWHDFQGFKMSETGIRYPGDPEMKLIAEAKLRDETIRVYECVWIAVIQADGSFRVARMD